METGFETIAPSHIAGEVMVPGPSYRAMVEEVFCTSKIIDFIPNLYELRSVKTEGEIEKIKIANEITVFGIREFMSSAQAGITEVELESKIYSAVHTGGVDYRDARSVNCWPLVMSGIRTAKAGLPFSLSEKRKIEEGDLVLLEMGVSVDGYWSDISRTVVAGSKNDRQDEIISLLSKAREEGINLLKPGILENEVDHQVRKVIEDGGYGKYFHHHTGHGIGFKYHEPYPFLHPDSKGILKKGMITTLEPGIYIEGFGGVRIEDDYLIGASGPENLTGGSSL
jgi:Xaa-Pro dipeptidase